MAQCNYPVLGTFNTVGIFLADDCGAPVPGDDKGWIDRCPGAFTYEPVITTAVEDFTRTCADGNRLTTVPGYDSLDGYDIQLDLHNVDPAFWSSVAGATPVVEGGETVGWDMCQYGYGSASIFLWRTIIKPLDPTGCEPDAAFDSMVTIFPWVYQIQIREEGQFGSQDSFMRLTGRSRTGHKFGKGPYPLIKGAGSNPDTCLSQAISPDCTLRQVISDVFPRECGFVDVTPCTTTPPA